MMIIKVVPPMDPNVALSIVVVVDAAPVLLRSPLVFTGVSTLRLVVYIVAASDVPINISSVVTFSVSCEIVARCNRPTKMIYAVGRCHLISNYTYIWTCVQSYRYLI